MGMEKEADNRLMLKVCVSTRKENQQSFKQRINEMRARQAPKYLGRKGKTGTSL